MLLQKPPFGGKYCTVKLNTFGYMFQLTLKILNLNKK